MGNFAGLVRPVSWREHRTQTHKTSRTIIPASLSEHLSTKWQKPVWLVVAIYLILPNVALFISARVLGASSHGYINLDCLLIGVIGIVLPRGVAFLLLCLESCAAFADSVCTTYAFCVRSSRCRPVGVSPATAIGLQPDFAADLHPR